MTAERARAALYAFTRRMVEGATYEELTGLLDAVAAMSGAEALPAEIAGRRLALLEVHHRDAAERDRVLRAAVPDLASVPLDERVRGIAGAARYAELVERYLRPLLPELQHAADQHPDDEHTQEALWLARLALEERSREPRGDAPAEDETPEETSSWIPPWPPHVLTGVEVVRRLVVARRPYREISEALDAVLELPDGELAAGRIATERIVAVHDQDDAEAVRVLALVAPVLATFSVRDRASAMSLLCSGRPVSAERHIPPLIDELEAELRRSPDQEGAMVLAGVKRVLERTRAGG